jgi:hypothetical protein
MGRRAHRRAADDDAEIGDRCRDAGTALNAVLIVSARHPTLPCDCSTSAKEENVKESEGFRMIGGGEREAPYVGIKAAKIVA